MQKVTAIYIFFKFICLIAIVLDVYNRLVEQLIVYYVRIKVALLNKQIVAIGHMLCVHYGYRKCVLQIPFFWNQSVICILNN